MTPDDKNKLREEWEESELYKYHPATERAWRVFTRDDITDFWLSQIDKILAAKAEEIRKWKKNMNSNVSTDEGDELKEFTKIYDRGYIKALDDSLQVLTPTRNV